MHIARAFVRVKYSFNALGKRHYHFNQSKLLVETYQTDINAKHIRQPRPRIPIQRTTVGNSQAFFDFRFYSVLQNLPHPPGEKSGVRASGVKKSNVMAEQARGDQVTRKTNVVLWMFLF